MNQFSSTSQTIFSRKKKNESRREKQKKFKKVKLRDELNVIQVETFFGPSVSLACVIITTTTTKYTHTQQRAHLDDEREKIKQNKSRRNT